MKINAFLRNIQSLFLAIVLMTISVEVKAQNDVFDTCSDRLNLNLLVKLKKSYDRCRNTDDLVELLGEIDHLKPQLINSIDRNDFEIGFSNEKDLKSNPHFQRYLYTDRIICLHGKTDLFIKIIDQLIEDLKYDDRYAYDRVADADEGLSGFVFQNIYKDIRIQTFMSNGFGYIIVD